jgi:hypothetical protein
MSFESPQTTESPRMREERLRVVSQKEAGRHLTQLIAILFPSAIRPGVAIDSFELIDERAEDDGSGYPDGVDESEEKSFDASVSSLSKGFDKLGLAFAIPRHSDAYTYDSTSKKAYLNTLAYPWEYLTQGNVAPILDIPRLKRAVKALKNEEEKVKAQELLEALSLMVTREESEAPLRYHESLNEPDHEALSALTELLDSIPEEMIVEVENITAEAEAKNHVNREYLRAEMRPALAKACKKVYEMSKLEIDQSKVGYPEFWAEAERIKRINNAIGAIRHGMVEHNLV